MSLTFSVNNFEKYWEITQNKVSEYLNDDLNEEKAIECSIHLWHMCDWFYEKYKSKISYNDLSNMKGDFGSECISLRIMRDICNSYKHSKLREDSKPMLKSAVKHKGAFSRAFSSGFDISFLEAITNDGHKSDFKDDVREVLKFWNDKISVYN